MAMLVKMMGHEVRFAINGFAALKIARDFCPDVVLLDIGLPDMNGYEIARELRFEEALKDTRFIAISALPAQQYRKAALDWGCEEFCPKPIDPKVLERLLAADANGTAKERLHMRVGMTAATEALAEHFGVTPQDVNDWLQRTQDPRPQVLLSWAYLWDLKQRQS